MTISSWPYVDQATTDIEYSRLFREFKDDGVVGSLVGDTSLEPYADSSGMQVKLRAGSAILRGYIMRSTATETLAVEGASANTRVDRLVLELNLSAPTVAQRIVPKILKGTSGSSTPPGLTQTDTGIYQMKVGRFEVTAGLNTISAAKMIDERAWVGNDVGVWEDDDRRPANPRAYRLGFNESRGVYEYYAANGTWTGLVSWNDIVGKPGTFPPSAHSHPISQITDLDTALAARLTKANPTFTGTLTGPTFNGNVNGEVNGIKFFSGTGTPAGPSDGDVWFSA